MLGFKVVLEWGKEIGLPECPYIKRWTIQTPKGSIRLHKWLGPDDDRAYHDHPWNFLTFVLKGGYTDVGPEKSEHLKAFAVQYRSAEHQHHVVPDNDGAWSLMITGPVVRPWGFWKRGYFWAATRYLGRHGEHPCN